MQQKLFLTTVVVLFTCTSLFPQITEVWEQKYSQYYKGEGEFVIETLDGGFAIVGNFGDYNIGNKQHFLIRTDNEGNILWNKDFWEFSHHMDCNVQLTFDGGIIVCGGGIDGRLIKFDESGNITWNKTYGDDGHQFGRYGIQTSDSGYAFTGSYDSIPIDSGAISKIWLVKTNQTGDVQWTKTYGELGQGLGASILQTSDYGYLITGWIMGGGLTLIKTSSTGNVEWSKNWCQNNYWCNGDETQQTIDGGYISVGYAYEISTEVYYAYIVKTDASCDTLWTKKFKKGAFSWAHSVKQLPDSGYIIAAITAAKYGPNPFGGTTADEKDAWIFKLNQDGEIEWERVFGGPNNDEVYSIHLNADSTLVFTGGYVSSEGKHVWLVKLDAEESTGVYNKIVPQQNFQIMQNYPNPFNPSTTIKYILYKPGYVILKIYRFSGQEIETVVNDFQSAGEYSITWQPKGLPGGIYFYSLQVGEYSETKKILFH